MPSPRAKSTPVELFSKLITVDIIALRAISNSVFTALKQRWHTMERHTTRKKLLCTKIGACYFPIASVILLLTSVRDTCA
jgi:hypothetical protein